MLILSVQLTNGRSMMGSLDREDDYGLIPRASRAIFDMIENTPQENGTEFRISCSYLEIYNETIQDLFDTTKKNLQIRESPQNGIYVGDLTEEVSLCYDASCFEHNFDIDKIYSTLEASKRFTISSNWSQIIELSVILK